MDQFNFSLEDRYNPDDEIPQKCTHPKEYLAERTSHSEKNPGRKFLSCQRCNTFIRWIDNMADPHDSPHDIPALKRPREERTDFQTNPAAQQPTGRPREDPDMVFYLRRFIFALNKLSDSIDRTSDFLYRLEKAKQLGLR